MEFYGAVGRAYNEFVGHGGFEDFMVLKRLIELWCCQVLL